MTNFRRPYFAKNIREFWQRWHISLSTWFRDYVYISLGGNRVVKWRWYYNLFITFLVSGLWHGAAWTFVVWGAFHGALLAVERLRGKRGLLGALHHQHGVAGRVRGHRGVAALLDHGGQEQVQAPGDRGAHRRGAGRPRRSRRLAYPQEDRDFRVIFHGCSGNVP